MLRDKLKWLWWGLVGVALVASLVLVSRRQETRRGAANGLVDFLVLPDTKTVAVGETWTVVVKVDVRERYLSAMEIGLVFDNSRLKVNSVTKEPLVGDVIQKRVDQATGKIVLEATLGEGDTRGVTGVASLFRIELEALAQGEARLGVDGSYVYMLRGISSQGTPETLEWGTLGWGVYQVGSGAAATDTPTPEVTATATPTPTATLTPSPTPTPTAGPGGAANLLKFKMAFEDVGPDSSCAVNWPVKVTVVGPTQMRSYENVGLALVENGGGLRKYLGVVNLDGISEREGLAILIKGPKHAQTKYAVDGQTAFYNRPGGQITILADQTVDFSGYPLVPGDVVGRDSGEQDGVVDGVDFAYVKAKALLREQAEVGGDLKADLDGNCLVNSLDVANLMVALQEKQDQLY